MLRALQQSFDAAGIPQEGIAIEDYETHVVRVDFLPSATPTQRADAQLLIDNFDWSETAHSNREVLDRRTTSIALLSAQQAEEHLLRAVLLVLIDQINVLRAAVVPPLPALTIDEVRKAVQDTVNAGSAD